MNSPSKFESSTQIETGKNRFQNKKMKYGLCDLTSNKYLSTIKTLITSSTRDLKNSMQPLRDRF